MGDTPHAPSMPLRYFQVLQILFIGQRVALNCPSDFYYGVAIKCSLNVPQSKLMVYARLIKGQRQDLQV